MLQHLLESKPRRTRARSAVLFSLVVHVALAGTAIAATRIVVEDEPPRGPEAIRPIFVPPSPDPAPRPSTPETPEQPSEPVPAPDPTPVPTVEVPTTVPTGVIIPLEPSTSTDFEPVIGSSSTGGTPGTDTGTGDGTGTGEPLWADEVEKAAMPIGRQREPRYPELLRSQRIEGRVVVAFVVDENGRVEANSVKVIESAHALFEPAVRQAVLATRFKPAQWRGRAVRQLVQQAFVFELRR